MQKAQLRTFEQAQSLSLSLSLVAFTSILALSCALFPHFSYAAQNKSTPNTYTKASLSNDAKPYWTWDDATKTLNFYYGEMPAGATEISLDKYVSPSGTVQGRSWNNHQDDCQHVVIDPSFKDLPSVPYLDYWFYDMFALKDASGLGNLNGVTSLNDTFQYASNLSQVDFTGFNASSVTTADMLFYECSELQSVDLSTFATARISRLNNTFCGCVKLKEVNFCGFNAENLNSLQSTFQGCSSLINIDLSSFDKDISTRNSFLGVFSNCTALRDANFIGLTFSSETRIYDEPDAAFYQTNNLRRISVDQGFFNYYSDSTSSELPSGNYYAYCDGTEVPGDVYGPITKDRAAGELPTTFITDKTASYDDYFYANGGTFSSGESVVTTSGTIDQDAVAPTSPTRPGYLFKGWKTSDGTAIPSNANNDYNFGKYGIASYNTFYADWEEDNPVTLTFDANGGTFASTGSTTITLDNQVPGETLASVEEPEREGYTFAGWEDASGTAVVFPLIIPEANVTYTATWTAEPGPGPEPTPSPEPSPSTDDSDLLPVTGDTHSTGLITITIVGALAALVVTLALVQERVVRATKRNGRSL